MSQLYREIQKCLLNRCPEACGGADIRATPTVSGVDRAHQYRCKGCGWRKTYENELIENAARIEKLV